MKKDRQNCAWSRHSLLDLNENEEFGNKTFNKSLRGAGSLKPNFFFLTQEIDKRIFNPEQRVIFVWKTFTIFLILVQSVLVPIILAFPIEYTDRIVQIEFAVSCALFLDIFIKLNTGIYRQGHLDTNRSVIFCFNLKRNLLLDVYSSLPFAYFSQSFPILMPFLLFKLLKVWQVYLFFNTIQLILKDLTVMKSLYYLKIFVTVCLCIHWLACVWFYIGIYDLSNQYDSWVILERNWDLSEIFVKCIYYILTSISTLGYGDYTPVGINELTVSLLILFIGVIIFSFNIASIINLVIDSRQKLIQYQDKMIKLNTYMKQNDLPNFLKFRLRKYLEYTHITQEAALTENHILSLLSDPLREEIFGFTAGGKLISKCRVFLQLYNGKITQKLSKFFNTKVFSTNDTILEEGENSTQVYFIVNGKVEIFHNRTKTVYRVLASGCYFGEIGFFAKKPRTASIRCLTITECLTLKREDLDFILLKFPLAAIKTEKIELLCKENNYSVLDLTCYLCHGFGHIACNCEYARISPNQMNIPQAWVNEKKKSKKVNPRTYIRHNVHRTDKSLSPFKSAEIYKRKKSGFENEQVKEKVEERIGEFESENAFYNGIQRILTSEEDRGSYTEGRIRAGQYKFSIVRNFACDPIADDLIVDELI